MTKFLISLCAIMFCVTDVKPFRFDYEYYQEGEGWMKLHPFPANWTDARLQCYREGAVLASPENDSLWAAMKTVFNNSQMTGRGFFTGIHSTYSARKGDYYSIKGTPLSQMAIVWAPGKPNTADSSEDCLFMLPNGTLSDAKCSDVFPYVCYRKGAANEAVTKCGGVDSGYESDNRTGNCYKLHKDNETWASAFAACSAEGAYLAIINSVTEAEVLKELFKSSGIGADVAHIGHIEWEEHGLWMTVHGETLKEAGYDTWHQKEPNHDEGKECTECGAMYADGKLDDVTCTKAKPFICEKNPSVEHGEIF